MGDTLPIVKLTHDGNPPKQQLKHYPNLSRGSNPNQPRVNGRITGRRINWATGSSSSSMWSVPLEFTMMCITIKQEKRVVVVVVVVELVTLVEYT